MKKVLEAIRGVIGVSGVMIWEKGSNTFHKLLPARFEGEAAGKLAERLSRYCTDNDQDLKVIARFRKGWVFMFDQGQFSLLVLGKSDLNTTTLNLVLKSALNTLESTCRQPASNNNSGIKFLPDHVVALARAINLSLGFFQGQLSRFEIADVLRLAKSQLLTDYPALKHFTVDANGGVIVIKKAERYMDISSVEAAAKLITTFVGLARAKTNTAGFDIAKLTDDLNSTLSEVGFYHWFKVSRQVSSR